MTTQPTFPTRLHLPFRQWRAWVKSLDAKDSKALFDALDAQPLGSRARRLSLDVESIGNRKQFTWAIRSFNSSEFWAP